MKTLRPIMDKNQYSVPIEKWLVSFFYNLLYRPVLDAVRDNVSGRMLAAKSSLLTALQKGFIRYQAGYFTGQLSASLTKELRRIGAQYDKRQKSYRLVWNEIPIEYRGAIASGNQRLADMQNRVKGKILEIRDRVQSVAFEVDFSKHLQPVFYDLHRQYLKTASQAISVSPKLTETQEKEIAEGYTNNMKTDVSGWADEAVVRLREKTEKLLFEGFRADKLAKIIRREHEVSARKARFIARQEMSLLVSKYREVRYRSAGIEKYQWSTSHDERVRQDHKDLSGRVFRFSDPPIVDKATGKRANPGEDFNCRCVARPIFEEVEK